jgi:probable phosphoglycerate mutase
MDLDVPGLKNRYYGFRHGESLANVEGIIVSNPELGTVKYGLSDKGRRQVEQSVSKLAAVTRDVVIVSSDFRRTLETAEIIRSQLRSASVRTDVRLRERFFGEWDGTCYLHYSDAWQGDEIDPDQEPGGAESANAVRSRMVEVVNALDAELAGDDIILVSHGDPLRMLQSAFENLEASLNQRIPYFETAGWRLLNP